MKISVAVITYNQEATIAQTLDSILCQKGTFELEIVIGEDCSKDGTWYVCYEYAKRYPEIIVLLPNLNNLGIMANFARVMKACTGDYVSILAGDDYWCDERKLQKQLDFFAQHAECGVVCTNGFRLFVKSGKLVPGLPPYNPAPDGDVRRYYHNRFSGVYAMPLTLLIKRDLLQYVDFDEYVRRRFPVEDYPMQSVLAHHTRFGYVPDMTAVYRVYGESATFVSAKRPGYLDYHLGLVDIRRYLNALFSDDVPFSEEWAEDYIFYKEFLLFLSSGKFSKAKTLVEEHRASLRETPHFKNANKATRSIAHFLAFRAYKWYKSAMDRHNRL